MIAEDEQETILLALETLAFVPKCASLAIELRVRWGRPNKAVLVFFDEVSDFGPPEMAAALKLCRNPRSNF